MKAIFVDESGGVILKELPKPEIAAEEVLIRVAYAGLCATDLEIMDGTISGVRYPIVPGHEWSGIVEDVGGSNFESLLGRAVVAENFITCLQCEFCRRGDWSHCPFVEQVGFARHGAYAEYLVTLGRNVHILPEGVGLRVGAMVEPTAVAVHVISRLGFLPGDRLVVFGAGTIGLLCLQAAQAAGAVDAVVVDRREDRLSLGRRLGAVPIDFEKTDPIEAVRDLHGGGADIVIEASGNPKALKDGIACLAPRGKLAIAGFAGGRQVQLCSDDILLRNAQVVGTDASSGMWSRAIRLLEKGLISADALITHEYPLSSYREALDGLRSKRGIKAFFRLDAPPHEAANDGPAKMGSG